MTFPIEKIASDVLEIRQAAYEKGYSDGLNDGVITLRLALESLTGVRVVGEILPSVTFPNDRPAVLLHIERFDVDVSEYHPAEVGRTSLVEDLAGELFGGAVVGEE